ncbi:hypothetical protein CS542_03675 [Pedobacter sp. IW39]|nr:hypothetical protein CS542_03675 [Pedobacter sp. IW39]
MIKIQRQCMVGFESVFSFRGAAFCRVYYAPDSLPGQSRSLIDRLYSCECFAAEVLFKVNKENTGRGVLGATFIWGMLFFSIKSHNHEILSCSR